jgi:hypothetical protein
MALQVVGHKAMTIPSGGSTSNAITDFDDAWGLTIYSPVTVTATMITVQVEPTSSGTSFVTLQSGGSDVTIPASRATVISPVPFKQMRVTSSSAEGQDDVFKVTRTIVV